MVEKFWPSCGGSGLPLQRSPVLSYLPPPLILCTSLHYSSTFPLFHLNSTEPWPFLYKSLLLESHSSLLQLPTSSDCGSRATPFYLTTNTQLLSANILQHTDFFFPFTKDIQEFSMTSNTQQLSANISFLFLFNFTKDFT